MTRSNRGRQGAASARRDRDSQTSDAGGRAERIAVFQKTKMCKFHIMGVCTQGNSCRFAHEREQLQSLPDLSCTKLCKTLIATGVCNNPDCCYAHNREELRAMPDELRRGTLDSVGGAPSHQSLDLQGALPLLPGPVASSAPLLVQSAGDDATVMAGAGPCGLVVGQSMPQGVPMCPGAVGVPVMQAAFVQIVQASQAHAAEAARLQLMAANLQDSSQQMPAMGQCFVQSGMAPFVAAGPQGVPVAQMGPGGMVYTALPGQAWPCAAGSGAAAPVEGPLGQACAAASVGSLCAQSDGRYERQESGRTESTAASSDSGGGFQDAIMDAADEGGGPRAPTGGPLPGRGFGVGFSMKGVAVKNTFLERVESQDFDLAPTARALRAVQTASGRLDVMAPSLD